MVMAKVTAKVMARVMARVSLKPKWLQTLPQL
jgi:hypothetical protein